MDLIDCLGWDQPRCAVRPAAAYQVSLRGREEEGKKGGHYQRQGVVVDLFRTLFVQLTIGLLRTFILLLWEYNSAVRCKFTQPKPIVFCLGDKYRRFQVYWMLLCLLLWGLLIVWQG